MEDVACMNQFDATSKHELTLACDSTIIIEAKADILSCVKYLYDSQDVSLPESWPADFP